MTSLQTTSQGYIREETLQSHLDELLRVEKVLTEVAYVVGLPEDRIPLFIVAVTEALSNAILHGNQQQPDKRVFMRFQWSPLDRMLVVEVQDEGQGFDPSGLPDPTQGDNLLRESGRGIFIMRNLADEVVFHQGGRCVELRFIL
ncbi:MAG: ATP-binding protein [Bacteroidia bacterium]|nr:ATP-binding protein [Bacteroidia bacterium]